MKRKSGRLGKKQTYKIEIIKKMITLLLLTQFASAARRMNLDLQINGNLTCFIRTCNRTDLYSYLDMPVRYAPNNVLVD